MSSSNTDIRQPPPFGMPVPLAKGLIISFSLLFAAGAAVYENPQVRQWVDESRRKVAIALHSLGDELAPPSHGGGRTRDASTREDESPEAAERRRQARQEILERGRLMEESRKARQSQGQSACFDDLVDKDGALRMDADTKATTTAAQPQIEEAGLRHRITEGQAASLGSKLANPFADEVHFDQHDPQGRGSSDHLPLSRGSTPTLPMSPPVPPKPAAYQSARLIDTEEQSNHPSEQLVDLTPTTSASSAIDDLAGPDRNDPDQSQSSYLSINEWAQNQSHQTLPQQSGSRMPGPDSDRSETIDGSIVDSAESFSHAGVVDDDAMSEMGDVINTPSTWTEVSSQFSGDE